METPHIPGGCCGCGAPRGVVWAYADDVIFHCGQGVWLSVDRGSGRSAVWHCVCHGRESKPGSPPTRSHSLDLDLGDVSDLPELVE